MIEEELLEQTEEIINLSDKDTMALSLSKNSKWAENYQMAMTIKLKGAINSLNKEIIKLRKSTNISSLIMGIMTFFILVLTVVLVGIGYKTL